jgi:hypothetical protein
VYQSCATSNGYWYIWDGARVTPAETDSHVESPGGFENNAQVGQAINLSGTSRFVTQFEIRFLAGDLPEVTTNIDAILTLYQNDKWHAGGDDLERDRAGRFGPRFQPVRPLGCDLCADDDGS